MQTAVPATPAPAEAATDPAAVPTAVPTTAPTEAPPLASATPAPTSSAAPALGVDESRDRKRRTPNRTQGGSDAKCEDGGELLGTVVDPSASTSPPGCNEQEPAAEDDDDLEQRRRDRRRAATPGSGGAPTPSVPGYSLATVGPAPIGVPNFFIDKFRIPPFLLPIYQAAGIQYGIRWEILAAINEIETDYGRNLNVSSAGALGWMQFMPATWAMYGVDANGDGEKDPFNPVDGIFAAARYLRAAGADKDLYRAIFAYNHADWYVESVLMRARVIGGLPADLVGSLTGLTQGRFPVAARSTYAGALTKAERAQPFEPGKNVANVVESDGARREIRIFSRKGAPVIAVQDGRITRIGSSRRRGRFVELQDSYGNTYLY
ncbi:MAG TPA: lytic murein transglycosylase, partial [Solirubrobacteraceae bacterium]|nr:lytic murein transglycosylase [Solirubrobacteraceae bacterium]